MKFIEQIESFVQAEQLCCKKDKILIAVSGGIDSMVLLDVFQKLGHSIAIAHCNFSLRSEESNKDEDMVIKISKENRIEIHLKTFDTASYSRNNKISIQEAARELRYTWFNELAEKYGYHWIATAHHFDDNIETILINLQRGTGVKGMRGILPKRDRIIRPLLEKTKDEIREYARRNNIEYREDASNVNVKYLRNKIRHEVIPILKKSDKDFYSNWMVRIKESRSKWDMLYDQIQKVKELCVSKKKDDHHINIEKLTSQKGAGLMLFHLLDGYGFSVKQRAQAYDLIGAQSGKQIQGNAFALTKDRTDLILTPLRSDPFDVEINEGQSSLKEPLVLNFYDLKRSDLNIEKGSGNAYFDKAKLNFPLKIRNWRQGDKFYPYGMKGKKKVSDLLIDSKVDLQGKKRIPIMTSNEEIIWVMGIRTSEKFRVAENTDEVLMIEWVKDE